MNVSQSDLRPWLRRSKLLASTAALLFLPLFPFVVTISLLAEHKDEIMGEFSSLIAVIFQRYKDDLAEGK